ncbi:hypothetical protein EU803_15975 [Loktanella sp. IMCC34160]|uniref:patatin-like phospholipase family protein n=1 Tax=Loktanella sp. IMCC34160 TaxID=2510646 RepID=UPI00101CD149|nr:patatin-like phospholipase family protein [Loktanella sp. IMCC34160]RYG89652.1 hypothetical protein EU803_15975 [Loktanella sp. IMCC34160]
MNDLALFRPGPVFPIETAGEPRDAERVLQRNVRYLCFEGGGGKGVIFLGAIRALTARGVLQFRNGRLVPGAQIDGIAGSSAGALTAVLLSCGYDHRAIQSLIFGAYNFNRFFDQPSSPARRPTVAGYDDDDHRPHLPWYLSPLTRVPISGSADDGAGAKLGSSRIVHYLLNLWRHMGAFSGCAAYDFFDRLIAMKAARLAGQANWRDYHGMTFEQHFQTFGIRLVLTGSNFETGKSAFFSAETCPNMRVAVAARISMSLPLIFKPVRISAASARRLAGPPSNPLSISANDFEGVWVDGGYMNNLPQTAFSHLPGGRGRTLGFTLNDYGASRKRIRGLADFLAAYAQLGMFGTGESHETASTGVSDDRVALMAGDASFQIGTIDFAFSPAQRPHVARLITAAERAVLHYFDRP